MSGSESTFQVEATGVYQGTLQEDMIDTVIRVKKPCIDVLIPELYSNNTPYPLTFVPVWFMTLPLRKGDQVWVAFSQDNLRYPYLYKPVTDLDTSFTEPTQLPESGRLVQFPPSASTKAAYKLSEGYYIIATDEYVVLHCNNQAYLINSNGMIMNSDSLQVKSQELKIEITLQATIQAAQVNFPGTAVPGQGPFNCLPNCLFTGAVHGSSQVNGV
jgi:hypothetical protein